MKLIFIIFVTLLISSCQNQTNNKSKDYVDTIRELENASTIINYDSLGTLISKVSFDVTTDNLKDFENGIILWIRVDSPQIEIKNLNGKDEIVIPETKLTIIIDYPLSSNYTFDLISKSGFTRTQLINEISKHYYQLYAEEEQTASIKTIPLKERKIYNRNQTNGKYGIWGHDIGDLVLDEIHVYKNSEGNVTLVLQLES